MEKSTLYVVQCVENKKFDIGIDFVIQPIFNLSHFVCIGGEVLVRGTHRNNVVPPNLFISQLEENGGILEMGYYVMDKAFAFIAREQKKPNKKQLFTLNISSVQLNDINFAENALQILAAHNLEAGQLVFEITHSAIQPDENARLNIIRLEDAGIKLAWDGIGNLEDLNERLAFYTPDYIKLDRSCLITGNLDMTLEMLATIDKTGADIIIEGIENYTHVSTMLRHGVKYGQGYLFSRPISKDKFQFDYMQHKNH